MHVLAVNSVSSLLNHLSEQLQNTPPLAEIQGWNKTVVTEDGENAAPAVDEDQVCYATIV